MSQSTSKVSIIVESCLVSHPFFTKTNKALQNVLGERDNRYVQVDKKRTEGQTSVRSPILYRRYLEIIGQRA